MSFKVRTRFAPSPTGYMHIGNLRTALYEYLIAKSQNGDFILRIEDTDRERLVGDAEEVIYSTLKSVGLEADESPKIGGNYGPYRQSERKDIYIEYAKNLVKNGKAYYCFCEKSESESVVSGHKDKCRDLTNAQELLKSGKSYVIRQKMPLDGKTVFEDMVYGRVEVENKELEDQILIKSDGYPTYNFANVIDDHEMNITHVVRGSEYLSSTPKYNLLYEAFGWDIPKYIHLPLIMGKNEDGSVSKLSKRHGAVGFEDLVSQGYLPEAILNYIAFLGWCPESNQEIFSINELKSVFSIEGLSKSPSIFDYKKLDWFNSEYIKLKSSEEFLNLSYPYIKCAIKNENVNIPKISELLQKRISRLNEIPGIISFFEILPEYKIELFENKKSKSNVESSCLVLKLALKAISDVSSWNYGNLHDLLDSISSEVNLKKSTVMWPVRIALSGQTITPGGAIEILEILGKEESSRRIKVALEKLETK